MAEWTPPRPERQVPPWRDGAVATGVAQPSPDERTDAGTPPPRRRRTPFWRRSPARIVGSVLSLIALVVGVVALLGASLTPRYGDLAPYRATGVVDVRESPHAVGWTADLPRTILPGVPVRCVSFDASASSGSLLVLTGDTPPLGSSTNCTSLTTNQVASTVALFDAKTGRVVWSRDLRKDFSSTGRSIRIGTTQVVEEAGQVIVEFTLDGRFTIATYSTTDGALSGSVQAPANDVGQVPDIVGSLMLYSGTTSREGSSTWTLVDVRHVERPLWTAVLPDSIAPVLTARAVFAVVDLHSVRIDGTTGRVTRLGDGSVDLTNPQADRDGLYTTHQVSSGTIVTAWDGEGRMRWTRSGIGGLVGISRDCVVASLPGTSKITCLDKTTGSSRWTSDVGTQAFAYYFDGQTTDDVPVYRNDSNHTEIVVLDGTTGSPRFVLRLVPMSRVVAVSRTTGYLESLSQTGTATELTAFDTRTGRTLWQRTAEAHGDTELWGGHLVGLTSDGIATELGNTPPIVLGD